MVLISGTEDPIPTLEVHDTAYDILAAILPAPSETDVTVEERTADTGGRITADRRPLHSVRYDPDRHELQLKVEGGLDRGGSTISRRLDAPTSVWLDIRDGSVRKLEVESDRHRTIVTFHPREPHSTTERLPAWPERLSHSEASHIEFFG